jgi:hypothetical protein
MSPMLKRLDATNVGWTLLSDVVAMKLANVLIPHLINIQRPLRHRTYALFEVSLYLGFRADGPTFVNPRPRGGNPRSKKAIARRQELRIGGVFAGTSPQPLR